MFGVFLQRALLLVCLISFCLSYVRLTLMCFQGPEGYGYERQRLISQLEAQPGKHLILVRFSEENTAIPQWVYNLADLDEQRVLWAREMNSERNRRLLQYYADRTAWLLEANQEPRQLRPYQPLSEDNAKP